MGTKPKAIQVDYDLFIQMVSYISSHVDPNDKTLRQILDGSREKLAAIQRRDYFTISKTGKTPADLDEHVKEYQELLNTLEVLCR